MRDRLYARLPWTDPAFVVAQDIRTLHPFFTGSIRESPPINTRVGRCADRFVANIEHPVIRQWADSLMEERRELWASRGRTDEEAEGMKDAAR